MLAAPRRAYFLSAGSDRRWIFWIQVRSGPEVVRQANGLGVLERGAGGGVEVQLRLDAGELSGLEQAVEQRGDFGAALGARAVMIFSAQNHAAQTALGGVVVQRDARVVEEQSQARPQAQHVGDRLAEAALRQRPRLLGVGPVADGGHDGSGALLPQLPAPIESVLAEQWIQQHGAWDLRLDTVEPADEVEDLTTSLRIVRLRLDELPSHVRPAMSQRERPPPTTRRLVVRSSTSLR